MNNLKEPPIAIAVTWGKDMINEKGGLLAFIRHFEKNMDSEDDIWYQKSRNKPQCDIIHVYIIVCNIVRYKLIYGGYATGETEIFNGNGHSWSRRTTITWPRLILAGPFVKAPYKIKMKGFQGFRYIKNELF
jgi:hypothetical protein